ncbi:MAG TPA: hypothetical protein PLM75_13020, partial [bacterium]|nr:hypothetical protein [bacterium]
MKLKNKLTAFILLITIIPLLIFNFIFFDNLKELLKKNILTRFDNDSLTMQIITDDIVKNRYIDLINWSEIDKVKSALKSTDSLHESILILKKNVALRDGYIASLILDDNGKCIASTNFSLVGLEFGEENWFKKIAASDIGITDKVLNPKLKVITGKDENFVQFYLKKLDGGGYLLNIMDWKIIQKYIDFIKQKYIDMEVPSGYGYIIAGDNNSIIGHPDPALATKKLTDFNLENLANYFSSGKEKTIYNYVYKEKEKAIYFYKSKPIANNINLNWNYAVGANAEDIYYSIKYYQKIMILTITLIVFIIIAVTLLFSKKLISPIYLVIDKMKAISQGDLMQEPIKLQTNDETKYLIESFNNMLSILRSLVSQIKNISTKIKEISQQTLNAFDAIAAATTTQSDEITDTTSALTEMSAAIQEISLS